MRDHEPVNGRLMFGEGRCFAVKLAKSGRLSHVACAVAGRQRLVTVRLSGQEPF
jgi:hypothetical protein